MLKCLNKTLILFTTFAQPGLVNTCAQLKDNGIKTQWKEIQKKRWDIKTFLISRFPFDEAVAISTKCFLHSAVLHKEIVTRKATKRQTNLCSDLHDPVRSRAEENATAYSCEHVKSIPDGDFAPESRVKRSGIMVIHRATYGLYKVEPLRHS